MPVHERTDTPTPVINPFQAPAFAEGTPGSSAHPAEDPYDPYAPVAGE